jgi:GrpB-like predicted nucleotidyltransferase (UPF0157 family)
MKRLVPHDSQWKAHFAAQADRLRQCLGAVVVDIHHIGGTAIPDTHTKPVIDIALEVTSLAELDTFRAQIEAHGYEARGEHGIPGRRYFKKHADTSGPGFHVHAFAHGSEHVTRHIQFRDFLLHRPDIAQQYSALKTSLTTPDGTLVPDYTERKDAFVSRIVGLAARHASKDPE